MGKTPGQAAYEEFQRQFPNEDWGPWGMTGGDEDRSGWEAIAKAAIAEYIDINGGDPLNARDLVADALAAQPEIRIAPCPVETHDAEHHQVRTYGHWLCGHVLARMLMNAGVIPETDDREDRPE